MNSIVVFGRLTKDVEIKTAGDTNIASFSVASNGNKKDDVSYFDCKAFRQKADLIGKYFAKGDPIVVYGQMHQYTYQKQDGTNARGWELYVDNIDFVSGGKPQEAREQDTRPMTQDEQPAQLPF